MTLAGLSTYALDDEASGAGEQEVAAFERDLGGRLDDDYRAFLRASGPVGIEEARPLELEGGGSASLGVLYGLGCEDHWDVRAQTFDVYPGRIPDETIPIGEDGEGGGDLVLLVFDGPRRGEVCVWLHDHPEIEGDRLDAMRRDLDAAGQDVGAMNDAAVIHAWEHAHADELDHPPLWGNVRALAPSFAELLRRSAG